MMYLKVRYMRYMRYSEVQSEVHLDGPGFGCILSSYHLGPNLYRDKEIEEIHKYFQ